jgi:hypothetical protein
MSRKSGEKRWGKGVWEREREREVKHPSDVCFETERKGGEGVPIH